MKRTIIKTAALAVLLAGTVGVLGATTAEAGRGIHGATYSAGRGI